MCDYANRERAMVVIRVDSDKRPTIWCDPCLAPLVTALNDGGISTVASCCGHGRRPGFVALDDGRVLVVARDLDESHAITRDFPGIDGEDSPVTWDPDDQRSAP